MRRNNIITESMVNRAVKGSIRRLLREDDEAIQKQASMDMSNGVSDSDILEGEDVDVFRELGELAESGEISNDDIQNALSRLSDKGRGMLYWAIMSPIKYRYSGVGK